MVAGTAKPAETEQTMENSLDKRTLEEIIKCIEKNYVENAQGRVMRQVAEVIVENLSEWVK